MAKEKAHIYRIPKTHKIASGLKPGESMTARMKMMDADDASEGEAGTYPMEEESAEMAKPMASPPAKKKDPMQAIKEKRALGK